MSVPALHARTKSLASDYDQEFFDEEFTLGELSSGERICPPPSGGDGTSVLRALLVIAVAIGGGWAFLHQQPDWAEWLQARFAAMSPAIARQVAETAPPAPTAPAAAPMDAAVPPPVQEPTPASEIADAPGAAMEAAPVTTGSIAPADEQPSSAPLPPPNLEHADRYQKRAAAVGLHPDISRSLLARLSTTDYRNAEIAIQTAVAKTADDAVFVWPRQRKPELALFRVRFVPGATPECRRYVVTVTKDGWSTTAPPMERCGSAGRKTG